MYMCFPSSHILQYGMTYVGPDFWLSGHGKAVL